MFDLFKNQKLVSRNLAKTDCLNENVPTFLLGFDREVDTRNSGAGNGADYADNGFVMGPGIRRSGYLDGGFFGDVGFL